MPGVPTYRGCEACRRQKKKCDKIQPSCSRCTRVGIPCIGVGRVRFKFTDHSESFTVVDNRVARRPNVSLASKLGDPSRVLTNKVSIATGMLVSVLEVTDPGYDVFCFGPFIKELPKRIGYNPALDASASAFASAVRGVKAKQRTVESLHKYVAALHAVQETLSDPTRAYTAETLCAIYLIMLCHTWVACKDDRYPNHGEGLAHLIGIMVNHEHSDPFLTQVMITVSVAVILEGVFNPSIKIQPWIQKLAELSKPSTLDKKLAADRGITFQCLEVDKLGMVPELIHNPWENIDRIRSLYEMIRADYPGVKHFSEKVLEPACVGPPMSLPLKLVRAVTQYHAAQCLMLAIGMVMNGFLRILNPSDYLLVEECYRFCADSITLAERAKARRPLAAGHIPMSIIAAWLSSDDTAQQAQLRCLISEYEDDYAMTQLVKQATYLKQVIPRGVASRLYAFPPSMNEGDEACRDVSGEDSGSHTQYGAETCSIL